MSATGTITTWAAMMQADIRTAAPSFRPSLDFWPTSGSIAALAKWNRTTEAAKVAIRRSLNSSAMPTAPRTPSPAVVSSSGEVVVDLRLADQEDGDGAGGGHAGDEEEHRTVADEVGKATRKGRRDDIAAVVERFVSPRAACHGRPADQAQTQGCHGRREDRRGRPDRCLRRDDHHERRHQIEHDATRGDHRGSKRDGQALPPDAVDKGTGRGLGQHRPDLRRRQRNPDPARVPVLIIPQEGAQERTHPVAHVREESVRGVERMEARL